MATMQTLINALVTKPEYYKTLLATRTSSKAQVTKEYHRNTLATIQTPRNALVNTQKHPGNHPNTQQHPSNHPEYQRKYPGNYVIT